MNDQLRDIFFQLLRIGLWGKGQLSSTQPITAEDWNIIRKYAMNHTVEGIIYDSFAFLEENQLPPQALRLKWAVRMDQIEQHNEKMNQVIAKHFVIFSNMDIHFILQKGLRIAAYHRIPNYLIRRDIDWCFGADGCIKSVNIFKDDKRLFNFFESRNK